MEISSALLLIGLFFTTLYAVAKFIKICIDIYNSWPRKRQP